MSKLNPTKLPVVSNAKIGCRTLEKKNTIKIVMCCFLIIYSSLTQQQHLQNSKI